VVYRCLALPKKAALREESLFMRSDEIKRGFERAPHR